jgi:ABC-type branched-subunit amino acid transport system ATPase component
MSAVPTSDFDLEFRHVTKDFGEVRAVDDATFQVRGCLEAPS